MTNTSLRNSSEVMKDEMVMRGKILSCLSDGPLTLSEIAAKFECSSDEVVFWAMAMWRYGLVEEVGKPNQDGYYKYQLVE